MEKPVISFIDSHCKELFTIKDGEEIEFETMDGTVGQLHCRYIDEYHFEAGNFVYHIRQFAENMERYGTRYRPVTAEKIPGFETPDEKKF
jgi:hypothetical protein